MRKGIREFILKSAELFKKQFSKDNEELPYYILIFLSFLFFIVATNLFVELTEELKGDSLGKYDEAVTDYVTSFRTPERNQFFTFITDIGDVYGYLIITVLVMIFFVVKFQSWKFILQLIGVLLLSGLSNVALKKAINRARPEVEHLVVVETLSYPSGHAMSAMAFYGFLIYLLFQIKMSKWLRTFLTGLLIFLLLSIGISRVYLGVHYPSDVAGGFIAGLIWVTFCIILFNIIDILRRRKRRHTVKVEKSKNK